MPEENNRIITDSISDFLFFSNHEDTKNISFRKNKKFFFIGNLMIDSLKSNLLNIEKKKIIEKLNLKGEKYIVVTLHRPSNIDNKNELSKIIRKIVCFSKKYIILFFLHPRLKINFSLEKNISEKKNIIVLNPLNYLNFMKLVKESFCIITDSGGIQEETTYLKKPCLTLRKNTERPITIRVGTNTLVNLSNIDFFLRKIDNGQYKIGKIPQKWDGKSALRMLKILKKIN
jgi:UDP-N-acetylglucosamine 2-epimerase (non-hydrolysing)